jgi:glyoxylase-like metal-dependent hydrolase (beta-lactamase superfamily II)
VSDRVRVRAFNTGWTEHIAAGQFLNGGRHPDVPGGALRAWAREETTPRPDGSVTHGSVMIPNCAWLIEAGDTTLLLDTGLVPLDELHLLYERYEGPLAHRVLPEHDLVTQLAGVGVAAEDVDVVMMSHLHYDHLGAMERFPNARFLVHPVEVAYALAPYTPGAYYYPDLRHHVLAVLDRIGFVERRHVVAPGVEMAWTGGHSPGHCIVFVDTPEGRVALVADLIYSYRGLEHDWPGATQHDVAQTRAGLQLARTANLLLVNHDPLTFALFPDGIGGAPVAADVLDYMRRLRTVGAFALGESGTADIRAFPGSPLAATG